MSSGPSHWTIQDTHGFELINCPCAVPEVQKIFDRTHHSAWTRDRRDRANEGTSVPKGYHIDSVQRVQNPNVWKRYAAKRNSVKSNGSYNVKTSGKLPEVGCKLENQGNEVYLFHGTPHSAVESICANGFDMSRCKDGLFGKTLCFSDSCTKADEYSGGGSQRKIFLSRVALGNPFYTKDQTPVKADLAQRLRSGYDSIHGDRNCTSGFQEYALADADQAYPEYLVTYHRSAASETSGYNF